MDDAMYDMQTGSQDDGAGHEPVKRKPVRPAELRLDDSKENSASNGSITATSPHTSKPRRHPRTGSRAG